MVMTSRHARQQRIGTKVAFLSAAWIACARVVDSFFVKRGMPSARITTSNASTSSSIILVSSHDIAPSLW
jgi:hypothetical protein